MTPQRNMLTSRLIHIVMLFVLMMTLVIVPAGAQENSNRAALDRNSQDTGTPSDTWGVILTEGADPNAVAARLGFVNLGTIAGLDDTYLFSRANTARDPSAALQAARTLDADSAVIFFEQQIAYQQDLRQQTPEVITRPTLSGVEPRSASGTVAAFISLSGKIDALVAGRGMRGTGSGNIVIAGIPTGATVSSAYLYWMTSGTSGDSTATINGTSVSGTLIGTSNVCVGSGNVRVYRATVTSSVTGNSTYEIAGLPNGSGSDNTVGASLVVVYSLSTLPNRTIDIVNGSYTAAADGGATFAFGFNSSYSPTNPANGVKLSTIVGEGQSNQPEGFQYLYAPPGVNAAVSFTNNPFGGSEGSAWDSLTYDLSGFFTSNTFNSFVYYFSSAGSPNDCVVLAAAILSYINNTASLPSNPVSDPLFRFQTHLRNFGQTGGLPGADANVVPAWNAGYDGTGVTIAVVDDGLQYTHPDLSPNYVAGGSYDFWSNDSDPAPGSFEGHGTSVGGVSSARDNSTCGVGAAYRSGVSGIRLIVGATTDAQEANALAYQPSINHIYNNSWGPSDDGRTLRGPGTLLNNALANGVANGRGGRGSIYVFAAGNGGVNDNANADGYASSPYTLGVGAIDHNGAETWYSEPGASILISAPTGSVINWQNYSNFGVTPADIDFGVTTTDLLGSIGWGGYYTSDCTSRFGGTSSAAPLVSGVIALMLDANPNLGWRDVQHILARTAVKTDPNDSGWAQNSAGYWVNHKFGFGRVNAQAAVNMALTWNNVPPRETRSTAVQTVNTAVPDNNSTGISRTVSLSVPSNFFIERVEVVFNATHTRRGDLEVELISPTGSRSMMMTERPNDDNDNFTNARFTSVRHYGENGSGTWTLRVADREAGITGTWNDWQLILYGYSSPLTDGPDRIGIYNPANAVWMLRNTLSTGEPDTVFVYGGISGGIPLAGDWNGDGIDTPGMYVPSTAYWFMRNSNTTGTGDITAVYGGIPGALPVVGDWNGDGVDTIGLYNPATGQWLLRNSNSTGDPDLAFVFGGIPGALPVVGDWNGDGVDTIGLYVPSTAVWLLRNSNSAGSENISLVYGGISGGVPVVGDWNNDNIDTVGMYVPNLAYWFLRNTNTTGEGQIFFVYGGIANSPPIIGHWSSSILAAARADVQPELTDEPERTDQPEATAEATDQPEATAEATDAAEATAEITQSVESTAEVTDQPEVTPEITPEVSDEPTATLTMTESATVTPIPTLPPPATITESPTATASATATPLPLTPPIVESFDAQPLDWNGSTGWQWVSDAGGGYWRMLSTSVEVLTWTRQIDLRAVTASIELTFASQWIGAGSAAVRARIVGGDWATISLVTPSADWTTQTVDLSAYAGQVIELVFVWQAAADTTPAPELWALDDVMVAQVALPTETPTPTPTLSASSAEITAEVTAETTDESAP